MSEGIVTTVAGIEHFATEFGAAVQCDSCGDLYKRAFDPRYKTPEQRASMAADLRREGWDVDNDHRRHTCPHCVFEIRNEAVLTDFAKYAFEGEFGEGHEAEIIEKYFKSRKDRLSRKESTHG